MYGILDPELPSEYYNDLFYEMYVENRQLKWNEKDISKQVISRNVQVTMAKEDISMEEMYKEL